MNSSSETGETSDAMSHKIGVFVDIAKARHAMEDAIAAGVSRDDITMVAPHDDSVNDIDIDEFSLHPSADMYRGHIGGALGGAVGGLVGSLFMYIAQRWDLLASAEHIFIAGSIIGVVTGLAVGAAVANFLPAVWAHWSGHRIVPPRESIRDTIRSASAGAIGGMFGAVAGTLVSYLMGIPTLWYFIGAGFFAAAIAIIVGGLVGAMSGRGLAPHEAFGAEDLTDDDQNVLVSIDCHHEHALLVKIEDLLRRDGALLVRTA
jgi:hypothetical protein